MDVINLLDGNFFGTSSSVPGRSPKNFKWSRGNAGWDNLTVFTDSNIGWCKKVESPKKLLWIMEPRAIWATYDPNLKQFNEAFEIEDESLLGIITHDEEMLNKYPDKTFKSVVGGCWVNDFCEYKLDGSGINRHIIADEPLHNISTMISHKDAVGGHVLRHQVVNEFPSPGTWGNEYLDSFGTGVGKFLNYKEPALTPYLFHIAIENSQTINYFTEKLIDALVTSTVPIYWGCPNISDYFNIEGFITFNTMEELKDIVYDIKNNARDIYASKEEAIRENFKLAQNYLCTEDWLYDNIIKEILHA